MNDDDKTPNEGDETTVSAEDHNKVVVEMANLKQDNSNVVEELKKVRQRAQDAEAKLVEQKPIEPTPSVAPEVDELTRVANEAIDKRLSERAAEEAARNRVIALEAFKATNKEFLEANDPGGLKWSALTNKLDLFNTDSLTRTADFENVLKDAYKLMGGGSKVATPEDTPVPTEPSDGGTAPEEVESTVLSDKEQKIVRDTYEGDKEKFLKVKAKRPDFVASLLQHMV